MFRALAAVAWAAIAAASSAETCAGNAGSGSCAPARLAEHSLLQTHQTHPAKRHGTHKDDPAGTELQQEKSVQGRDVEKDSFDSKAEDGLRSKSKMDPYPADFDLDTDYPRDDKGTHADTVRELQSATLPGDGDIGRNTKPGLRDSWNVDQMFVTDSDGGGHVSLREIIPWGYRSQGKAKREKHEEEQKDGDKSGLLSTEEKAYEEQDEKMSKDNKAAALQRHRTEENSKSRAPANEHEAAPRAHHKHAAAKNTASSDEAKGTAPAGRGCQGQE